MKHLPAILTSAFIAVWLVVFSLGGATRVSAFDSPADSAQTSAPADNEDHSEDIASLDDGALPNRRIELPVRVVSVGRLPAVSFNPPTSRHAPASVLPRSWQFVERAAAAPRPPSSPA